jgi:hypothetical protein
MDNTFVLRGNKSAHFSRPPDFVSSPPQEVGLTQNPGGRLAKILTTNHFLFFKNILERPLKKINNLFLWPLLTLHYIQRPSSSKVGFSRMSHGPCEVFSTASRL